MRMRHWCGKLGLLASLLLSISACGTAPVSRYTVEIPMLTVEPIYHECSIRDDATGAKEPTECVTLIRSDYRRLIVELKASCLALGGTNEDCLTK